jgi:hypothetical protein
LYGHERLVITKSTRRFRQPKHRQHHPISGASLRLPAIKTSRSVFRFRKQLRHVSRTAT